MKTITWKEIPSSDFKGLYIVEFPPITKPKVRTSVSTVDGRDGSIVQELGYESYTKSLKIGIRDVDDINDIISYFTGSGDLIFGNEEDKVYKAAIYDDIDYEKLINSKEATVNFYVQPFKYSATESKKDFTIDDETSITIKNSGNTYSKPKLTFYGTGTLNIYLNDIQLFVINLDDEEDDYITIDINEMEAYKDGTLKNRSVLGNYDNFKLNTGENTISWDGTITSIEIENYSRWI